jgi:transcriptional regulator with XRE-family HTH domain/tetratricopeptide (TPR) repeat protein
VSARAFTLRTAARKDPEDAMEDQASAARTRSRLRHEREARHLTQQDVADQLARLAWLRRGLHVGVNADMVSKWERGDKAPSRLYAHLLCLLYEKPLEQMDLTCPVPRVEGDPRDGAMLIISGILDTLGQPGDLIRPGVRALWREELVKRRTMLKLMGLVSAGTVDSEPRSVRPDSAAVAIDIETLDTLANGLQGLYHSAPPAALMIPVRAHMRAVDERLRGRTTPRDWNRLLRCRGQSALLAGRLSAFDLHEPVVARGYYNLALEAAREAQDGLLAAAALGHVSFIASAESNPDAALSYLNGAAREASGHATVGSWLAAVEAEVFAQSGQTRRSLAALDRAEATFAHGPHERLPVWFDYYDATRLAGFRGYVQLRAGRTDEAAGSLAEALRDLPTPAIKQRAVFLTDLATVHLQDGDLVHACAEAGHAAQLLRTAGYATADDRLVQFREAADPWKNHRAVLDLDEQLALT